MDAGKFDALLHAYVNIIVEGLESPTNKFYSSAMLVDEEGEVDLSLLMAQEDLPADDVEALAKKFGESLAHSNATLSAAFVAGEASSVNGDLILVSGATLNGMTNAAEIQIERRQDGQMVVGSFELHPSQSQGGHGLAVNLVKGFIESRE